MSVTTSISSTESNTGPIGVFDSGVGGLSILDKIHQLLPQENLIYLADSAHAPYGQKEEELVQQRCQKVMEFFLQQNVKAVVLACNTATAAAVAMLREKYTLPIIGMEPALKPAAQQSHAGIVGVLATAGTIDSDKFIDLKSQYAEQVEIITKACPGLVEQIEKLDWDRAATIKLLQEFTKDLINKGADTLVLGCTHYSLISDLIAEVVGRDIKIMDTGFAVANELKRRLQESKLEGVGKPADIHFYSTGSARVQEQLIERYWQQTVVCTQVESL